jgi:hypothetical protein
VDSKFYNKGNILSKKELGLHPTKKNIFVFGGGSASFVDEAAFTKIQNRYDTKKSSFVEAPLNKFLTQHYSFG